MANYFSLEQFTTAQKRSSRDNELIAQNTNCQKVYRSLLTCSTEDFKMFFLIINIIIIIITAA